jgi:alkanesulfonate monooxygenase SsuD/methylene tetrahydromethanopterin reductase-like flavin-dependent oxidoreductase (luciferase family)
VQTPHPPIWIGGNGKNARRRVARAGQGWMPLLIGEQAAATSRTAEIGTPAQLAEAIDDLRGLLTEAGRDPSSVSIQVQSHHSDHLVHRETSWDEHRDFVGQLAAVGVTDVIVRTPGGSVAEAIDTLEEYAREGIATLRS